MRYQGGKARIADEIVATIVRQPGVMRVAPFVEPFCGGCNVTVAAVRAGFRDVRASDANESVVRFWRSVQRGASVGRVTEADYITLHDGPPSAQRGWALIAASFGARGQRGGFTLPTREVDHQRSAARVLERIRPHLARVLFACTSYEAVHVPDGATVYCDPPYADTAGYAVPFATAVFWRWAAELALRTPVFVSEYAAPTDVRCVRVWSRARVTTMGAGVTGSGQRVVEHLFRVLPATAAGGAR